MKKNKKEIRLVEVDKSELKKFDKELEFFDQERKKPIDIRKITLPNGKIFISHKKFEEILESSISKNEKIELEQRISNYESNPESAISGETIRLKWSDRIGVQR